MAKLKVHGVICPNDYAWYYRWFDEDCTCPNDVEQAIADANGETLEVEINSPGGEIASGSAIYTLLKEYGNVEIKITGEACSAASVIAMAGHSTMSPTSLMMVHCVSSSVCGNHSDMEKMAEVLSTADQALCTAYMAKTGMTQDEALAMMEAETWLTAAQAKERGLVDEVMFEESGDGLMVASNGFALPTQEQMDRVRTLMEAQKALEDLCEKAVAEGKMASPSKEMNDACQGMADAAMAVMEASNELGGEEEPVDNTASTESVCTVFDELKQFMDGDVIHISVDSTDTLALAQARAKYLSLKGEMNNEP